MVKLQSGAFENLLRNIIINASLAVKLGGRGVIVWGAFLAAGIGELLYCEKSFNAFEYRKILQNGLLPTSVKFFSKEE